MTSPQPPEEQGDDVARRRADDEVLAELQTPTQIDEAREALDFWRAREKGLPLHRRAERKEAREMVVRWQGRLREAERTQRGPSPLEQLLDLLGIHWRPADPRRLVIRTAVIGLVLMSLLLALALAVIILAPDLLTNLLGGGGD